jgi:hypothetical protein
MPIFAAQSREQLRRAYLTAWRRFRGGEPLEPLEGQIAAVIAEHPEYIGWLESGEEALQAEFSPQVGRENPFLHLALHLAIREQVATDRPRGIAHLHARLCGRLGDAHAAEHAMLEPLEQTLWEAQRSGTAPDEQRYLQRLEELSRAASPRR